jgi:NAD(P)-dependent dehydrogenase (short-subunit alcohol dehydrogenase family)
MQGKRGLIMGVANDRSIAWGIAKAVAAHGAELAFTYQGEALERRVRPLAQSVGSDMLLSCDVTDPGSIDAVFATLQERWGKLDFLVHAIAFSDKEELKGQYLSTSRDNFLRTLDISCYSLTAILQRAAAFWASVEAGTPPPVSFDPMQCFPQREAQSAPAETTQTSTGTSQFVGRSEVHIPISATQCQDGIERHEEGEIFYQLTMDN